MNRNEHSVSPARQAAALLCTVVAAVCTLSVAVMNSRGEAEDTRQDDYQQCLSEEGDRIHREGGLLDAEDLCDIHPGRP